MIAVASDRISRLIKTFCDLALACAYSGEKKSVGAAEVRAVPEDRRRMGLPAGVGDATPIRATVVGHGG